MAFGTESIKPVLKIAGPGSPIVTAAKLIASTRGVAIDMPAGPSELLVIAEDCGDETPKFVAADLISANEHGKDSASVAVTTSKVLAGEIAGELEKQIQERDRKSDILASLDAYSAIVLVNSLEEVIAFANDYAPEHLEVFAEERRVDEIFAKLENAGSVFLGKWNCKTLGDYAIGVNHILPTGRAAKAFSAVGAWTFLKTLQFSRVSEKGLRELFPVVEEIATAERFDGHRNAVRLRAEKAGVKKQF
jgi:histidinol dehydrogenase